MAKQKRHLNRKKKSLQHKHIEMRSKQIVTLGLVTVLFAAAACNNGVRREPGKIYMPDMAYSRAVETYTDHSYLTDAGIYYDASPVAGTIKRGGVAAFPIAKDAVGDTTNYVASKQVVNPLPALDSAGMVEAARLYMINCGTCHGAKLDGNGPLYNGGNGPYPIAPRNLVADPIVSKMPEGQMMYSVTYGKNLMGSYASQLNTKQRWMVIHYVKSMQPGSKPATTGNTTAADSVNTGK
jgi:mono/diheme cytochrome c family protein